MQGLGFEGCEGQGQSFEGSEERGRRGCALLDPPLFFEPGTHAVAAKHALIVGVATTATTTAATTTTTTTNNTNNTNNYL